VSDAAGLGIAPIDPAATGLARFLRRLGTALLRWIGALSRSAAIRQLEFLRDDTLRDLGLRRGEIYDRVRRAELPWS
jgi:uncharacterized protein YjiS (DUF1127 family)